LSDHTNIEPSTELVTSTRAWLMKSMSLTHPLCPF
jgi:hypothetical protein